MKNDFASEERRCELLFLGLGPCWHLYTPENHPVILTDEADFKVAMTLLAICSLNFPSIRILTFQWMSNHLHITLAGPEEHTAALFRMLKKHLRYYLRSIGHSEGVKEWTFSLRHIEGLKDLRNVISYNNRNGFLVNPNTTPFNYPWGANRFFFNQDARKRFEDCHETIRLKYIRGTFHTHKFDSFTGLPFLDGFIPPPAFCDIVSAEGLFRNARHYFSAVSRNIEGIKTVANEIGENIYYMDDELYSAVTGICREQYNVKQPFMLPANAKLEVARRMYYDYNASPKQIARILRIDQSLLINVFPTIGHNL